MSIQIEDRADGVRVLIIDRPERRNALDSAMYRALTAGIVEADADPAIRVSVVTGAGMIFTSGNDIANFQALNEAGAEVDPEDRDAALNLLRTLVTARKPLIAAIEGFAVGIGVTMLPHFDLAFAGHGTRFRAPFVPLGLSPEGASSLLFPQFGGTKRATEILMIGEVFSAEEAAKAGLINRVVDVGEALEVALERAGLIAASAPESVEITKMLLRRPHIDTVLETLDVELVHFERCRVSDDAQAAFAKFMGE